MRIIPAIDIIDGKCVRLSQGNYDDKKIYNDNPTDVAKSFEQAGLRYLHLVDLDGAKAGQVKNWKVVESIALNTRLEIDFGGGIKTKEEIERLFNLGVQQVNLGSIAVKNRDTVSDWLALFGAEKIILSADVLDRQVKINGWTSGSVFTIDDLIESYLPYGLQYVTCTDISKDGMLLGTNIDLYKSLKSKFPALKIIASGGVSSLKDIADLTKIGVDAAIVGKAIYENKIALKDLITT
jgi:phosphoribosylformimino-5-aminoimidazole carboxamide ribotide isomerase